MVVTVRALVISEDSLPALWPASKAAHFSFNTSGDKKANQGIQPFSMFRRGIIIGTLPSTILFGFCRLLKLFGLPGRERILWGNLVGHILFPLFAMRHDPDLFPSIPDS